MLNQDLLLGAVIGGRYRLARSIMGSTAEEVEAAARRFREFNP